MNQTSRTVSPPPTIATRRLTERCIVFKRPRGLEPEYTQTLSLYIRMSGLTDGAGTEKKTARGRRGGSRRTDAKPPSTTYHSRRPSRSKSFPCFSPCLAVSLLYIAMPKEPDDEPPPQRPPQHPNHTHAWRDALSSICSLGSRIKTNYIYIYGRTDGRTSGGKPGRGGRESSPTRHTPVPSMCAIDHGGRHQPSLATPSLFKQIAVASLLLCQEPGEEPPQRPPPHPNDTHT